MRVCASVGCPTLVPKGQRYCNEHKPKRAKDRRPSAAARGYDARWQKFRAGYLATHPHCVVCGEPTVVVDHVDGQGPLGARGYDESNLQPLCVRCHNSKTNRLDGGFGRPKVER